MFDKKKKFRFSIFAATENTLEVPPKKENQEINVQEYLEQNEQTEIQAGDAVLQDNKIVTSTGRVLELTDEEVKAIAAYEYSGEAKSNAKIERLERLAQDPNEQTR